MWGICLFFSTAQESFEAVQMTIGQFIDVILNIKGLLVPASDNKNVCKRWQALF